MTSNSYQLNDKGAMHLPYKQLFLIQLSHTLYSIGENLP
jgi:hypothetical protein